MTFTTRLTVRSYEVDGFRHVNNATMIHYLEAARGDLLRALGLWYECFHRWKAYPVVVRLEMTYCAPAYADDLLEIEVTLREWKRTQFVMSYCVRRAENGEVLARAQTHHAFVNPEGKPIRVPEPFRIAFENASHFSTGTNQ